MLHSFTGKLLYSYRRSAKIYRPFTYNPYLTKYFFNWSELILQSVNLAFINYHTFITFCFPIWLERQRGFRGNHPRARQTLYCRIWGLISGRIVSTFSILTVVPDYTLFSSILSIFCTFSFQYRNKNLIRVVQMRSNPKLKPKLKIIKSENPNWNTCGIS